MVAGAETLTVVAPFIKEDALRRILDALAPSASVRIFTRWRVQEVAAGISDLSIFELVRSRGGEVLLHPLLHAKAYVGPQVALVGSSNVSASGLGWCTKASVEALFQIGIDDPQVVELLEFLALTSCKATAAIQRDVEEQAAAMELAPIPPSAAVESHDPRPTCWVPRYNVPEAAWAAYCGQRPETITSLVKRDLGSLGIPEGIEAEAAFRAIVGVNLAQGFTGKLIQECAGLNAVDAAERFRELLLACGEVLEPGELGTRYQAFIRWVGFFVSGRTLKASGFSIN